QQEIVDVMIGCGFPQERQGMNLARRAALLAELPQTVPGTTVNRFCASSLQTIRMAFHAIKAGEGDVFVAGGVESTSQVSGYPKSEEELHPRSSATTRRSRTCTSRWDSRRRTWPSAGTSHPRTWTAS